MLMVSAQIFVFLFLQISSAQLVPPNVTEVPVTLARVAAFDNRSESITAHSRTPDLGPSHPQDFQS